MEHSHKDPGKLFQLEKYLKKSIRMALQDVIPWSTLTTLLNDMASSLAECQLLIKILMKELQFMHNQKQVENMPETIEKEESENHFDSKTYLLVTISSFKKFLLKKNLRKVKQICYLKSETSK